MRVASVGLPHCVQTLHVLKWDTEELMDTRVLMSHLFSPNNLNFFSVTPFPVSTPNMQLGVKLVEDSSADGVPHVIIANKVIFYCMNPRCMAILPSTAHPWKRIWGPGAGFDYSEVLQYSWNNRVGSPLPHASVWAAAIHLPLCAHLFCLVSAGVSLWFQPNAEPQTRPVTSARRALSTTRFCLGVELIAHTLMGLSFWWEV